MSLVDSGHIAHSVEEICEKNEVGRDEQILDMERKGGERQNDQTEKKKKKEHLDLAIPEAITL